MTETVQMPVLRYSADPLIFKVYPVSQLKKSGFSDHRFPSIWRLKFKKTFYDLFENLRASSRTPITFIPPEKVHKKPESHRTWPSKKNETISLLDDLCEKIKNKYGRQSPHPDTARDQGTGGAHALDHTQPADFCQELRGYIGRHRYSGFTSVENISKYRLTEFGCKLRDPALHQHWPHLVTYLK